MDDYVFRVGGAGSRTGSSEAAAEEWSPRYPEFGATSDIRRRPMEELLLGKAARSSKQSKTR